MACPYFMPLERLENGAWPHPARLPLGSGWRGHCTAPGHEGELPEQHTLEAFCNLGYAGSCAWSPLERPWDAIRFAVAVRASKDTRFEGANSATGGPGRALLLRYVCERNHLPVSHGNLEYDLQQEQWLHPHEDVRLQKMAECFLDSYRKRTA